MTHSALLHKLVLLLCGTVLCIVAIQTVVTMRPKLNDRLTGSLCGYLILGFFVAAAVTQEILPHRRRDDDDARHTRRRRTKK
jgi:hypothetical protein